MLPNTVYHHGVPMSTRDTANIRLSSQTKAALDELRHPGQSYDGLLQELLAELKRLKEQDLAYQNLPPNPRFHGPAG